MSKILELAKRIASTGGLETKTTETISGTYDSAGQQRLLSHAYTIGANLTITNGELILSRLADNGTGMTVEFGSDITLSGDGILMLGDLGQGQPNQDFSASRITGTLPSTLFPAGHVLQVLSGTHQIESFTQSTGFVTIDLNVTIKPSSASSKFFIICNTSGYNTDGSNHVGYYTIYRDSTNLGPGNGYADVYQGSGAGHDIGTNICISELDSPNNASAITYGMYARTNNASYKTYWSMNNSKSNITVMEIAG